MFVKIQNNNVVQYPYTLEQMRQDYADTSFPKNISVALRESFGVFDVEYEVSPEIDIITQRLVTSTTPQLIDGRWILTKTVEQQTPEQMAINTANKAEQVRSHRNKLLASSDWTQLPDSPVNHEAWSAYRQLLRDVTIQEGFPWSVIWPEQPSM